MKLFEILFETAEEYYQSSLKSSGRLNKELAAQDFSRYKRRGVQYVEYNPETFTKEGVSETSDPNDIGGIDKVSSPAYSKQKVIIDLKNNIILMRSGLPEHDPLITFQLRELLSAIPELATYQVKRFVTTKDPFASDKELSYGMTVQDFLSGKQEKSGRYPRYKKGEELYDEFKFEVFKDLTEFDWYHATRKSSYEKIKVEGLRPSKDFGAGQQQRHGWTQFNFDLQNAVYLTHDIERARDIANVLVDRYEEDAVVLKVSGKALSDVSKVVVDEDILRDEYTDEIYPREAQGIPEYVISITSEKIAGLGYKSRISKEFIDVAETIKFEKPEEDNES